MSFTSFIFFFFSRQRLAKPSGALLLAVLALAGLTSHGAACARSSRDPPPKSHALVSRRKVNCDEDAGLQKYYYFVKRLEIDVSGVVPIISAFDVFAVSNAGLEAGWAKMESYSVPLHFVFLDIEDSADLAFATRGEVEPQTNLEHPGYHYRQKVGLLPTMDHRIDKLRFAYDRSRKTIFNTNEGIIGQTRLASSRNSLPERPFLRISIKSEKASTYVRFQNNKRHEEYMNTFKQTGLRGPALPTALDGRPPSADYPDDPQLTSAEFAKLSLGDKFMYKFLHGRTAQLADDPREQKYERAWQVHAKKGGLQKYREWLFFEFTTTNPGENLPSFGDSHMTLDNITRMFRFAHEEETKREVCAGAAFYPYAEWTRMPNDFSVDERLDALNHASGALEVFKGLSLKDVFGEPLVPSEHFFGVPEPDWTSGQMRDVFEVGVYNEDGLLTRHALRAEHDVKFRERVWERVTWFPFRVLGGDSQVVNVLKKTMSPFSSLALRLSVDRHGLVLYSSEDIATDKLESKMLWEKFGGVLFDEEGRSLMFMGKVLGFISAEKLRMVLLVGSRRSFNYNGYLRLSDELTALMQRGFGLEEYRALLKGLFRDSRKSRTKKDTFNEKRLQMLF